MENYESFIFGSIVKKLDLEHVPDDESNLPNVEDPILKAIAKYENHPSIVRIKNYMKEKICVFLLNSLINKKFPRK